MLENSRRLDASAVLLLMVLCLIWGGNQTAMKIAGEVVPPVLQAGLRSLGSAVLLLLWGLTRGIPLFRLDRYSPWGVLAGLLFTLEFVVVYSGIQLTDVSRGVLLIYTAPFTAALGAHLLVPGEHLNRRRVFGLLLAFAGIVLVFSDGLKAPRPGQIVGDMLCLLMGVLWGIDMLLYKISPLRELRPERGLFYQLWISAALLPAISVCFGESWSITWTLPAALSLSFSIIFVSFFSYTAFIWLLFRYPASTLGAFVFLAPVFGVVVAALLLGEPLKASLIAALALNAAGIVLVNR